MPDSGGADAETEGSEDMTYDDAKEFLSACNKEVFKESDGTKVIWSYPGSGVGTAYGWFDSKESYIEIYGSPYSEFKGMFADKLRGCGTPI